MTPPRPASKLVLPALWGAMALGLGAFVFLRGDDGKHGGEASPDAVATAASGAPSGPVLTPASEPLGPPTAKVAPVVTATAMAQAYPPEVLQRSLPPSRRRRGTIHGVSRPRPKTIEEIDRALQSPDPAVPLAVIERELESRPATDEAYRAQLVTRLAKLRNEPRALNLLIAEAGNGLTRSERLAALDALADPVPPAAKTVLEQVAGAAERDPEVRKRARAILK